MNNAEIIRRYKALVKMASVAKGLQLAYFIGQLQELRKAYPTIVGKGIKYEEQRKNDLSGPSH